MKLEWSTNVHEERDAPWQFMLPSMDTAFDTYVSLALWFEVFYKSYPPGEETPYLFSFGNDESIPDGGEKNKRTVQDIFHKEIFNKEEFAAIGPLGRHIIRKFASTTCRKNGCTKDEKDYRGRWKAGRRVSDVYDDVELPYLDAKMAAALCPGGPCRYMIKENSGVTDAFILEFVAPHIKKKFGDQVALVLGTALLWYMYSAEGDEDVPQDIYQRVNSNTNLPDGMDQPIQKIAISISGDDAEVYFNDIEDFEMEAAAAPAPPAAAAGGNNTGNDTGINAATAPAVTAGNNTAAAAPANTTRVIRGIGNIVNRPVKEQIIALHSQQRVIFNQNIQILRMLQEQDRQR